MTPDLVSVIIPCFNEEDYTGEAINSVLAQSYKNIEVLVVDDGSTDNTRKIIESFEDKRVNYLYQENSGESAARNTGMKASRGDYIAFLDADDVWKKNKLGLQLKLLKNYDLVYCGTTIEIDEDNNEITRKPNRKKVKLENYSMKTKLLYGNFVNGSNSAVVMKREIFKDVGWFDESLKIGMDWEYWTRIAWAGYSFGYLKKKLVKIRVRPNSVTRSYDRKEVQLQHEKILDGFIKRYSLTRKQRSVIFQKYMYESYQGEDSFLYLTYYFFLSIINDFSALFDLDNIIQLLKFFPKKFYHNYIK